MSAGRVRSENARIAYALRMVRFYAGEPTELEFGYSPDGHRGAGWYAWCAEYPDEGSGYLGNDMGLVTVVRAILDAESAQVRGG